MVSPAWFLNVILESFSSAPGSPRSTFLKCQFIRVARGIDPSSPNFDAPLCDSMMAFVMTSRTRVCTANTGSTVHAFHHHVHLSNMPMRAPTLVGLDRSSIVFSMALAMSAST